MRHLYTLTWCLLLPLVICRLLVLSRRNPGYRQRLPERFGRVRPLPENSKTIWIHAVSVGETQAAAPLVRSLQQKFPDHQVLITTTTPTGAAHAHRIFGDTVHHRYFPYDIPWFLQTFLDRIHPDILLVMETELWPNLFCACHERSIPVVIVNARLSDKSAQRYGYLGNFVMELLGNISLIACRTEYDAGRFRDLGAVNDRVKVTGNIKFDIELTENNTEESQELRERVIRGRPTWIAASTHPGEDEIVLASHVSLLEHVPEALLILAPRHPERSHDLESLILRYGLKAGRFTGREPWDNTGQVFLLDVLGELNKFYGLADIVFMGGSLVKTGGHNYLEPAARSRPILTGPCFHNFQEIAEGLIALGAAKIVNDSTEMAGELHRLFKNAAVRQSMGQRARDYVHGNRGSTGRVMTLITRYLELSAGIYNSE